MSGYYVLGADLISAKGPLICNHQRSLHQFGSFRVLFKMISNVTKSHKWTKCAITKLQSRALGLQRIKNIKPVRLKRKRRKGEKEATTADSIGGAQSASQRGTSTYMAHSPLEGENRRAPPTTRTRRARRTEQHRRPRTRLGTRCSGDRSSARAS